MATKTIPWNVKDYGSAHPLDEDQLRYLASEFKLPRERLDEMGSGLAFALNPRTAIFFFLVLLRRGGVKNLKRQ